MAKKSKLESGDHDPREEIDPPPPYLGPEPSNQATSYENPYPTVPEELSEPSAPPAQETAIYIQDYNDLPPNLPVLRINSRDGVVYHNGVRGPYGERQALLDDRADYYRYQGFPSAALIFLLGWLCPPLWLLGACCCINSRNPFNVWWARACLVMFCFTVISAVIAGSIVVTVGPETWRIRIAFWFEKINNLK
ncbi:hypothetical protein INT44_003390 [Umbelopsis vinacea]|uniref:Uncharacterized protein n=1 Tax=Umbelopsis vinacea TaxID=44442 RepID=A0A8H7PV18_9FUNG|nr:hypothetical protein INT44_003390 [Umbelopsis vinacea]KAI9289163.1 hypothetical protein BC943DRAFT_316122 [Umbelopsis sp. AD052]